MLAIIFKADDGEAFMCGGTLITEKIALTAAHRVAGIASIDLIVRAGEWNSRSTDELCDHEDVEVDRILIHENFDGGNLANNIALLILKKEFQRDRFINTICLPDKNYEIASNQECIAVGWGAEEFSNDSRFQEFLKNYKLPVKSHTECQEQIRNQRGDRNFKLNENFICTGGDVKLTMKTGDGGGPLVSGFFSNENQLYFIISNLFSI